MTKKIEIFGKVLIGFFVLTLLTRVVLVFYYMPSMGGVDQNVIYGIQRLVMGSDLYQNPEEGTYAVIQYTPLYYHLVASICRLLTIDGLDVHAIQMTARVVALLLNLMTCMVAILTIKIIYPTRQMIWIFGLGVLLIFTNHYYIRGDSLHFLFFALAIYMMLKHIDLKFSPKYLLFAAIFTALAVLSKQSGILLGGIIASYLLFFQRKILKALAFGFGSLLIFALLLLILIKGDLEVFYQNAYLGLKNGFSWRFWLDMFTNQFFTDMIPSYILGIFIGILFLKSKSDQLKFLGFSMIFSFVFAMVTGLKIGSSNNYFTEFLYLLIVSYPFFVKNDYHKIVFSNFFKFVKLPTYSLLVLYILLVSKGVATFSSVFVERWVKSSKSEYMSQKRLYEYFQKNSKLQSGKYIFFTQGGFVGNIFLKEAIFPTKDVTSQVYNSKPNTYDFSQFEKSMNNGLVQYIITPIQKPQLFPEAIPFIQFDREKFVKKREIEGYIIFEYKQKKD